MHDSIQLQCARAPLTNLFLANWKYVYSHSVSPRIPITICFYSLILVSTRSTFSWITFCSNFATRNSFISCFYHFIYSLFVRVALSSLLVSFFYSFWFCSRLLFLLFISLHTMGYFDRGPFIYLGLLRSTKRNFHTIYIKRKRKSKNFRTKVIFFCWFSIHCIWTAMVEKTRITKLWISVLQCIPKVNEVEVKLPCLCSIWISWKSFDVMQKSRDEDFRWRSGKTWKYGVCKCLCACMC